MGSGFIEDVRRGGDKEMEKNLLEKVDAFGYLYKAHKKEIRDTIQRRDE